MDASRTTAPSSGGSRQGDSRLLDPMRQLMRLATFVDKHGDTEGTRAEVRRVANEMVQALKQEPLAKVLVASPLMDGLVSLVNLGYDGRLLDLVGRCQCLAQMLPSVAIPDIPLGAVPAASMGAPRPPSLGAWELYARPGDVEDWETVLILSGCTWRCTGGGQRPVQLSRELVRLGKTLIYCGVHNEQKRGWVPGGLTCNLADLRERVMPWLRQIRGTVMICLPLPDVIDCADELSQCGWRVIYDCIDDWEAFAKTGYWAQWQEAWESRAIGIADVVTASAEALCEKVERWHPRAVKYLPNAGGIATVTRHRKPPSDLVRGAHGTVIYVGAVDGTWLDWKMVAQARSILERAGISINIIGGYTAQVEAAGHCLGEKPVDRIGDYLAWSDVAIIPFGDATISKSVDPIKYYEYRAAGLRVVATDVLTELQGRRGITLVLAEPEQFAAAVMKAIRRGPLPASTRESETGSWRARAKALLPLLRPSRPTKVDRPALPVSVSESDCALRVSWDMTTRCNLACPYCNTEPARRGRPPQPVSKRTVLWAWERFREQIGGPMYLSVDFGDPMAEMADVEIVAQLARQNKVDVVSNLKFGQQRLKALGGCNSNLAFACSYHPSAWRSLDQFLERYQSLQAQGLIMGVVAIVAWPPYLPQLSAWIKQLHQAGVPAYVLPFQGMYEGRLYPQAYSPDEQRLLLSDALSYEGSQGLGELGLRDATPSGRLCQTGWRYVYVHNDGTIARCPYDPTPLGNLFAGQWSLLHGATPCRAELCVCPDLWKYVVQK